jgi:basic membrane lipoprotein Med (substrate-binding protein (PBP1-ABC) superfamily)
MMVRIMQRRCAIAIIAVAVSVALAAGCRQRSEQIDRGFAVAAAASGATRSTWQLAARRGLQRIERELEAEVEWFEAHDSDSVRGWLARRATAGDDVLFFVGQELEPLVSVESGGFPGTVFILLPGRIRDSNLGSIAFRYEELGYVVGTAAAAVTEGDRVGVIRGEGQPWLNALEEGFVSGFSARKSSPRVVTGAGEGDVAQLAAEGVAVALYAADRVEAAVLEAAREAGLMLVVTDAAAAKAHPQSVFADVTIDVPEAMVRVAREVRDGVAAGRVFTFDVGSGVLEVHLNKALPEAAEDRAREAVERSMAEVTAGLVEFDELGL